MLTPRFPASTRRAAAATVAAAFLLAFALLASPTAAHADGEIKAAHVYHNHMPNFWPYYDVAQYDATPIGAPIRYLYDGDVILLKRSPPPGYPYFLPNNGGPMPHDDLEGGGYYPHHAKWGAYQHWPHSVAWQVNNNHPRGQLHVTMSGSVVNNVDSIIRTATIPAFYNDPNWGAPWRNAYDALRTPNQHRTLDMIHFTGHHTMGPLTGSDYFLKDLIYHGATLAQNYFLTGGSYTASNGFFPTELGFSTRLIPALEKLGIEWTVLGNVHYSRTLRDYPYLDQPGIDMMTSPPNRADMQNTSAIGSWVSQNMFNEQHVMHNKFPFASTPHWVKHVDPATGVESRISGIPVDQAGSWEEGYNGQITAAALEPFIGLDSRPQFFVIAHDGDNSSGRAGSEETWRNAGNVTYSQPSTEGMGIDEYLDHHPIPAGDVVHVQDGSWIDTRDSASDPSWYHWRLPMGIWSGQMAAFNQATGLNLQPKTNLAGQPEGMTVSLEYGYHYLERNFALLQASLNYAQTAEQIWLDAHPNHWQPTTALDHEITHAGNQLNPWMLSYPVKGDPANDWAGGANPAELGWYFLLASIDSGFGYYDENTDDHVKPTLGFNQSLHFTAPYVDARIAQDGTGPSIWWPQRWPYNPGSANVSKAEGWTLHHFDNTFAIYTYAFDVSDIVDIRVRVRAHTNRWADAADNTFRVYDPEALAGQGVANIDPARVGDWEDYPMQVRDLTPDINGVAWQPATKEVMEILPAQKIGDLYFTYLDAYRDQLIDYYIEAIDGRGNVTRSEIQQVFVGAGRYSLGANGYVEDLNGPVEGTMPFVTAAIDPDQPPAAAQNLTATPAAGQITLDWSDVARADVYTVYVTDDGSDPLDSPTARTIGGLTASQATDAGLVDGVAHRYRVVASNAFGDGPFSDLVIATPGAAPFATNLGVDPALRLTGLHFANWDPANATHRLTLVDDHTWEVAVPVASALTQAPYKLTLDGTWAVNWGGGASGPDALLNRGGGDARVDLAAGTWTLRVEEGASVNDALRARWLSSTPILAIAPATRDLGAHQAGDPASASFALSNAGGGTLVVSGVSSDAAWLTATLDGSGSAVTVDAQSAGLAPGSYQATITVDSNGGSATADVSLEILPPVGSAIAVTFTCANGHTVMGQSVYVVGSLPELGSWSPAAAVKLDPTSYPTWTGTIDLPASTAVAWKCLKRDEIDPNASVQWQGGADNTLTTPASGSASASGGF
ncbi:MAG: carbohydrate-binding module family 20 domain-containing protein [Acidobacteriota bacterium]